MYAPVCVTVMVAVDMHAARHWLGIVGNVVRSKLCFFFIFIMHTNADSVLFLFFLLCMQMQQSANSRRERKHISI